MNKLVILLLAVCLVSVQGFVRRGAPAADNLILNDIVLVHHSINAQVNTLKQMEEQISRRVDKEFRYHDGYTALEDQKKQVSGSGAPKQ